MTQQQLYLQALANKQQWDALAQQYPNPSSRPASVQSQLDNLHAANVGLEDQLTASGNSDAAATLASEDTAAAVDWYRSNLQVGQAPVPIGQPGSLPTAGAGSANAQSTGPAVLPNPAGSTVGAWLQSILQRSALSASSNNPTLPVGIAGGTSLGQQLFGNQTVQTANGGVVTSAGSAAAAGTGAGATVDQYGNLVTSPGTGLGGSIAAGWQSLTQSLSTFGSGINTATGAVGQARAVAWIGILAPAAILFAIVALLVHTTTHRNINRQETTRGRFL